MLDDKEIKTGCPLPKAILNSNTESCSDYSDHYRLHKMCYFKVIFC